MTSSRWGKVWDINWRWPSSAPAGQLEKVNELTKGDFLARVRQVVDGLAEIVIPKLLKFLRTVSVPACRKFRAADRFKIDTSATAKVKIGYLGDNFKSNFLQKVEKNISAAELTVAELTKTSVDGPILDELGDKAEISLAHLWYLLLKQPNGEQGDLLTNGYWNIFYIKDANGTRWAVGARGHAGGGWSVGAFSVDNSYGWDAGRQVFSR